MLDAEDREVADRLEGVAIPAESVSLFGHEAALNRLAQSYSAEKLHHAWLISGPRGIGKSTLAFHFARHIIAHSDPKSAPDHVDSTTWPENLVRQVAQAAHPELLHLTRPWDEKTKKFKTQLSVEEVRKTQAFYSMTAGAGGWRITIVDAADDMNASAANALLKILEEPPKRSMFMVITHAAGGLLPTIRSRCQALPLQPLSPDDVARAIESLKLNIAADEVEGVSVLAEGSVRRAIQLASSNVLKHYQTFEKLMQNRASGTSSEWIIVHALAEPLARRGAEDDFSLFADLVLAWIGKQARANAGRVSDAMLAGWAEVWEKATRSVALADEYNLDRKQVILSLFEVIFSQNKA